MMSGTCALRRRYFGERTIVDYPFVPLNATDRSKRHPTPASQAFSPAYDRYRAANGITQRVPVHERTYTFLEYT